MDLYFEHIEGEMCYTLSDWKDIMKFRGLESMELIKAVPIEEPGMFWCQHYATPEEKGECGKVCKGYKPRNGKSGCCVHYTKKFYQPVGETITLRATD